MNFSTIFSTIDAHVAGEAFRIVVHSSITLDKGSIHENHEYLHTAYQNELDFLLNEPRGHQGMHGCIVIPSSVADVGLLFFVHSRKKVFSYSALIATVTALIETGNLARTENDCYRIETVNGIYTVQATCTNEQVGAILLESSTHLLENQSDYRVVEVNESRRYLIKALPDEIPSIQLEYLSAIMKWGKKAAQQYGNTYPDLSGIILAQSSDTASNEVRSITFDPDGNIVRSPGIDSTFAIFTAQLEAGREHTKLINKSIFDSVLVANLVDKTNKRFSIQAQGFTTGMHHFIYDRDDPLKNGFLLK